MPETEVPETPPGPGTSSPDSGRQRLLHALWHPGPSQRVVAALLALVGFAAVVQLRATHQDDIMYSIENTIDWAHPFHTHGFFYQVLEQDGSPRQPLEWKDTTDVPVKGKLKIAKLNVDDNQDVPQNYGVRSLPTLLIFKGGQVVEQIVGAVPKAKLEEAVKKVV